MTPAGTSNELDVQNGWEENTHTHTQNGQAAPGRDGQTRFARPNSQVRMGAGTHLISLYGLMSTLSLAQLHQKEWCAACPYDGSPLTTDEIYCHVSLT